MLVIIRFWMIRVDRSVRNHLVASIGLTLTGIVSAINGLDSIGVVETLAGLVLLGLSIHRLGRLGSDT